MQAIIRSREDNEHYIQLEAAHASVVSAHIPVTYCFPPNILSAGSYGGVSNPPSGGSYNRRSAVGSGIGPTTVRQWGYADCQSMEQFSRNCLPRLTSAAYPAMYPDARHASYLAS